MRRIWVVFLLAIVAGASVMCQAAEDDVLYPVEILVTTTSDWTVVELIGATLVVESWTVEEGADAPGLQVTAEGSLNIGKTSYDETRVSVRIQGAIANPSSFPQIQIRKGHINETVVSIYAPRSSTSFARFTHRGVASGDPVENARLFSLALTSLAAAVEPIVLPAPSAESPDGQKVLAFYYPWYGTPSGPSRRWVHWNPAHANYDATHVPLTGYYDSLDPETVRRQIRLAQAAGIDGFIASWWGVGTFEDRAFAVLLAVAEEESFTVTVYYEDAGTPTQIASDVTSIVTRYASSPAFLSVDGMPVIFFYVRVAERFTIPQWQTVFSTLDASGHSVFAVADRLDPAYLEAFQGLHTYNPVGMTLEEMTAQYASASLAARLQGALFAATVIPGYQEAYSGSTGPVSDRRNGETYHEYWTLARASKPQWILITSWNEWHEGSEIEPSVEFGAAYLEYTATEAAAWHTNEALDPAVSEPDRDNDGVPDTDDYCPDYPGRPETNGC